MDLPVLISTPVRIPGLCLSVSSRLLVCLVSHLPDTPCRMLSIGCGTGLLEALLRNHIVLQQNSRTKPSEKGSGVVIQGVEVLSAMSSHQKLRYLRGEELHIVSGTWQILPEAVDFNVWLWVYPREPKLVRR